jgi:hypothetical protein
MVESPDRASIVDMYWEHVLALDRIFTLTGRRGQDPACHRGGQPQIRRLWSGPWFRLVCGSVSPRSLSLQPATTRPHPTPWAVSRSSSARPGDSGISSSACRYWRTAGRSSRRRDYRCWWDGEFSRPIWRSWPESWRLDDARKEPWIKMNEKTATNAHFPISHRKLSSSFRSIFHETGGIHSERGG